jgi:hypothetical protein
MSGRTGDKASSPCSRCDYRLLAYSYKSITIYSFIFFADPLSWHSQFLF